jgi:hypothetical protein
MNVCIQELLIPIGSIPFCLASCINLSIHSSCQHAAPNPLQGHTVTILEFKNSKILLLEV